MVRRLGDLAGVRARPHDSGTLEINSTGVTYGGAKLYVGARWRLPRNMLRTLCGVAREP